MLSTITLAGLIAVGLPACAAKKIRPPGRGRVNKVDALGQALKGAGAGEAQRRRDLRCRQEGAVGTGRGGPGASGRERGRQRLRNSRRTGRTKLASGPTRWTRRRSGWCREVVISEDQGSSSSAKVDLPDQAKARLDEMVNKLKADPERRLVRDRRPHRRHRRQRDQREDRARARAEAVSAISSNST